MPRSVLVPSLLPLDDPIEVAAGASVRSRRSDVSGFESTREPQVGEFRLVSSNEGSLWQKSRFNLWEISQQNMQQPIPLLHAAEDGF